VSDPSCAQLPDGACAHGGAIAHEAHRLVMPFGIDPVERVLVSRSRFLAKLEWSQIGSFSRAPRP
jgi:hypothetical protein